MRAGMFAWLMCSAICFTTLAYGQLAMSAYFLVLACVLPPYIAKVLDRAQRL